MSKCVTGNAKLSRDVAFRRWGEAQQKGKDARVYPCVYCGAWHLTSEPVRGSAKGGK